MISHANLALCAVLTCVSALQIPVLSPADQLPTHIIGSDAKPLVDSQELQDLISADRLMVRARRMYEIAKTAEPDYNHPTRVIGSAGHVNTITYIHNTLRELGNYYKIWQQPFPAVSGSIFESRLVLGQSIPSSAMPMGLTPPTKDKQPVYGDLVLVDNKGCQESDYPDSVAGNIAFIKRGECPFGTKSEYAGRKGATAAVVYNNDKGAMGGTLGSPSLDHIATFSLSGEDAQPFLNELQHDRRVDGIAYIDSVVETILTNNVLAQTTQGDSENCVMLGAHSDSVTEGPGINDDGSGTISLLEVAAQLSKFNVSNCVRFAWWAGEEEGLLGSNYYVYTLPEEENEKIRLFMDYDMMASPNFAYQIYNATNAANPAGSEELRDLYVDWYEKQGLNYTFVPFDGRSDYDGFIRNGIPGGGIATGAEGIKTKGEAEMFGGKAGDWYDPCYHQLCDDIGNVNMTAWMVNTKLIAHSVATYARSFKGFPKRKTNVAPTAYLEETKYRGSRLFI